MSEKEVWILSYYTDYWDRCDRTSEVDVETIVHEDLSFILKAVSHLADDDDIAQLWAKRVVIKEELNEAEIISMIKNQDFYKDATRRAREATTARNLISSIRSSIGYKERAIKDKQDKIRKESEQLGRYMMLSEDESKSQRQQDHYTNWMEGCRKTIIQLKEEMRILREELAEKNTELKDAIEAQKEVKIRHDAERDTSE